MTIVRRFICRRRGHRPESIFIEGGPPYRCYRCGSMMDEAISHRMDLGRIEQSRAVLTAGWPQVVIPPVGDPSSTWSALSPLFPEWEWALTVTEHGVVMQWTQGMWAVAEPGVVLVAAPGRLYRISPADAESVLRMSEATP